ncbi:hypothetical protein HOLleu_36380 [Holothuria leucospilota]|uniref:Uncharacterized protein n=1 Tax=Holothuria leucospilota TaxID=206669 RepID=A0A9Q0YLU5_HOLLE|nr:hypothetical protein HOLleu_36380 [Holothuria leucospilota]
MGSGLTKKKSSQRVPQVSMSQGLEPAESIGGARTDKNDTTRIKIQHTEPSYSVPTAFADTVLEPDEDAADLTKDNEELQFGKPQPVENAKQVSHKTYLTKPIAIKGTSRSDTQVLVSPKKEMLGHQSLQARDENFPLHLTQPASFSALTPELYKRRPQYEFSNIDKGKLLGEQKWAEACTDSLRNALLPNQVSSKNTQLSRSLPASIERMESLRTTSTSPVKSKDSLRTERRNSILSNLNCILDVIPENVDDEKDDPDEYEYSEMDLYF